jgi:hypothetical protein
MTFSEACLDPADVLHTSFADHLIATGTQAVEA